MNSAIASRASQMAPSSFRHQSSPRTDNDQNYHSSASNPTNFKNFMGNKQLKSALNNPNLILVVFGVRATNSETTEHSFRPAVVRVILCDLLSWIIDTYVLIQTNLQTSVVMMATTSAVFSPRDTIPAAVIGEAAANFSAELFSLDLANSFRSMRIVNCDIICLHFEPRLFIGARLKRRLWCSLCVEVSLITFFESILSLWIRLPTYRAGN